MHQFETIPLLFRRVLVLVFLSVCNIFFVPTSKQRCPLAPSSRRKQICKSFYREKIVLQKLSSAAASPALPNVESDIVDLNQAFGADEAISVAQSPPCTSNSMASSTSVKLSQEAQGHIERILPDDFCREEAFHAGEQGAKAPKVAISSNLSHYAMHTF